MNLSQSWSLSDWSKFLLIRADVFGHGSDKFFAFSLLNYMSSPSWSSWDYENWCEKVSSNSALMICACWEEIKIGVNFLFC